MIKAGDFITLVSLALVCVLLLAKLWGKLIERRIRREKQAAEQQRITEQRQRKRD